MDTLNRKELNSKKAIITTKEDFIKMMRRFKHAGHGIYVNSDGSRVIEIYGQNKDYVAYVERKISTSKAGYRQCGTNYYGVTGVHRLVAYAWVPGYQPGLEVDHINKIKTDNHFKNLRWVTHSQNMHNINPNYDNCGTKIHGRYIIATQKLYLDDGNRIKMTPTEYVYWRKNNGYPFIKIAKKLGVVV